MPLRAMPVMASLRARVGGAGARRSTPVIAFDSTDPSLEQEAGSRIIFPAAERVGDGWSCLGAFDQECAQTAATTLLAPRLGWPRSGTGSSALGAGADPADRNA
jgi:hypothetical protein